MNESKFKQSINNLIKKHSNGKVYIWSIADKFTSGIPDCYYSDHSDMWIEFKYGDKSYGVTEQQKQWIIAQHNRGRNTAIIHGYEDYINLYTVQDNAIAFAATFKKSINNLIK